MMAAWCDEKEVIQWSRSKKKNETRRVEKDFHKICFPSPFWSFGLDLVSFLIARWVSYAGEAIQSSNDRRNSSINHVVAYL